MDTSSESFTLPAQTISDARRYSLFIVFCLAMFLDAFNLSALFAATPILEETFEMSAGEASWVISAFQLTYASFLLISGRVSDIYHPKPAFVTGVCCLGLFSLGAGFVTNKIGLIILRALCGICAALTIPSALALIIRFFPEPREQARAIGIFGGVGGVGNVAGAIISALFVEYTTYHWVFYFITILAIPSAVACVFLIPDHNDSEIPARSQRQKFRDLDVVGVAVLTIALVLFIFAITSSSAVGWGTAYVLTPLIIAVLMVVAFFFWEAQIPAEQAAVPSKIWFLPNFAVLFGVSLLPYFWWNTVIITFYQLWQQVYGWSILKSAVHMIPIGVAALLISFTGPVARYVSPKWLVLLGHVMMIVATILMVFADGEDKYWPRVFPGLAIGSAGAMLAYSHTSIAIFACAPASMAGIVGAIFNCGIELGASVGLAVDVSIQTSVEQQYGGFGQYNGRAATFWWQTATVVLEAVAVLIFYKTEIAAAAEDQKHDPSEEQDWTYENTDSGGR